MKISTWNLDRSPVRRAWRVPEQVAALEAERADAYLLTEVHDEIRVHGRAACVFSDAGMPPYVPEDRAAGIWTNWPLIKKIPSSDGQHVACARFDGPIGRTILYATIIPFHGAKYEPGDGHWTVHRRSIEAQIQDWRSLRASYPDDHLIIAGDFNMTMGDVNTYVDRGSREKLLAACAELNLRCLTDRLLPRVREGGKANIDHVVVSSSLEASDEVSVWMPHSMRRVDRAFLSDHNGVSVEFLTR